MLPLTACISLFQACKDDGKRWIHPRPLFPPTPTHTNWPKRHLSADVRMVVNAHLAGVRRQNQRMSALDSVTNLPLRFRRHCDAAMLQGWGAAPHTLHRPGAPPGAATLGDAPAGHASHEATVMHAGACLRNAGF